MENNNFEITVPYQSIPIESITETIVATDSKIINSQSANNFLVSKTEPQITTKGQFAEGGLIFPHEDIISRAFKTAKEICFMGLTIEDIRQKNINNFTAKVTITFNHKLPIFQPNDPCIAAISQHYKEKYNINIFTLKQNVTNFMYALVTQLKNDEQIGIIAEIDDTSYHVTPIIASKKNDTIYIIVLDSICKDIALDSCTFKDFYFKLVEKLADDQVQVLSINEERQRDSYSCRMDAFIILKDALKKSDIITYFYKTNKTKAVSYTYSNSEKWFCIEMVELPKFLYKTVQNKQLLDKLTINDLQVNLKHQLNSETVVATKTLQQHLNKYNRNISIERKTFDGVVNKITKQNWLINTYLQTKPYRLLLKAFNILTDGTEDFNFEKILTLPDKYIDPMHLLAKEELE